MSSNFVSNHNHDKQIRLLFSGRFILFITHMITDLIKTMTKFSNAISYHQPDLSTNRRVYTSYLDSVIEKFKGQLTYHACVSGLNASCVCAVSHVLPS